ncbi:MAG TPA: TonB-dependent receptor [Burkholderiales bacterium]|nr:TonB-dependent receptor [Burkholderiales bacterium]
MRLPTPVELTCADPNAPCQLPNAFLADPALKQVVGKTVELGARGDTSDAFTWNAALFNTNLDDDIQFISAGSGASNAGFFQNGGKTRRRGVELGGHAQIGAFRLLANYSYVEAAFLSSFTVNSPNNSSADANGTIQVSPGDRIPGIPAQAVELHAEYSFRQTLMVGVNVNHLSDQYARGDENNQDRNGKVPGYTLVNLDASYQATRAPRLFGRVQNLFDRDYEAFGLLGENDFVTGSFTPTAGRPEPFFAVGAPRGFWIGLRYEFDKPKGAAKTD